MEGESPLAHENFDLRCRVESLTDQLAALAGGSEGIALSDANDEVWAERIKGIKAAYVDSCTRLGSALEELEQTLCLLTGDDYRAIV